MARGITKPGLPVECVVPSPDYARLISQRQPGVGALYVACSATASLCIGIHSRVGIDALGNSLGWQAAAVLKGHEATIVFLQVRCCADAA